MSTVRFGTFDVEVAWRPADLAGLPAGPVRADSSDMDHLLAAECVPGDVLLVTSPVPAATRDVWTAARIAPTVVMVPGTGPIEHRISNAPAGSLPDVAGWDAAVYAVRDGTHEAVERLGLRSALPALDDVIRVNAKTWSNAFVVDHGLPGAAVVATSAAEVGRHAEVGSVVKDPYGVAGRGALHLTTPRIVSTVVRHLERQVARGEPRLHADDHAPIQDVIAATDGPIVRWPVYELVTPRPWHAGRVTLIGDAVHAMEPHDGQSASMALEDAATLASCLHDSESVASALADLQRQRRERVATVAALARRTGSLKFPGDARQRRARDAVLGMFMRSGIDASMEVSRHRIPSPVAS